MNNDQPTPLHPAPSCDIIAPLLPLFDAGELDADQAAAVREHVATCPSCHSALSGYEIVAVALRRHYAGAPAATPPLFAEDIMKIADTRTPRATTPAAPSPAPAHRRRNGLPLTGALAAAVVLAIIGTLFALRGRPGTITPGSALTPSATSSAHVSGGITEITLSGQAKSPTALTVTADGTVWFIDAKANAIGRISPNGAVSEFAAPTANSGLTSLTVGPDGAVWFTESKVNRIGRISPSGAIKEYAGPKPGVPGESTQPYDIVTGADGQLWYLEMNAGPGYANTAIVPMRPDGTIGTVMIFPVPNPGQWHLASASDGALWIAQTDSNSIARLDPQVYATSPRDAVKEFSLPSTSGGPSYIAAGRDGAAWFVDAKANRIGRISPSGAIKEYTVPTADSGLTSLTVGSDGTVWFTESKANAIGRISPSGAITETPVPTAAAGLNGITVGPDGRIWFTESASDKIGHIQP